MTDEDSLGDFIEDSRQRSPIWTSDLKRAIGITPARSLASTRCGKARYCAYCSYGVDAERRPRLRGGKPRFDGGDAKQRITQTRLRQKLMTQIAQMTPSSASGGDESNHR